MNKLFLSLALTFVVMTSIIFGVSFFNILLDITGSFAISMVLSLFLLFAFIFVSLSSVEPPKEFLDDLDINDEI